MLKDLLWVGVGGFFGSMVRYLVNVRLIEINWPMPWPTLVINLGGSLLIGILMALSFREIQTWRLLVVVGFCGGFTTFSTFSYENMKLIQEGMGLIALGYMALSLIGGLGLVFLGFTITQRLLH